MKIVFLDVKTIGEDIDLSAYDELGEVVKYSFSSSEEVPARVTDADVIILNKVPVNEQTIGTAKNLKQEETDGKSHKSNVDTKQRTEN